MLEVCGMKSTPFIAIAPKSTLTGVLAPIYGLIRTNLHTYAKLNCLKEICFDINYVFMLNWIVWIRTV